MLWFLQPEGHCYDSTKRTFSSSEIYCNYGKSHYRCRSCWCACNLRCFIIDIIVKKEYQLSYDYIYLPKAIHSRLVRVDPVTGHQIMLGSCSCWDCGHEMNTTSQPTRIIDYCSVSIFYISNSFFLYIASFFSLTVLDKGLLRVLTFAKIIISLLL